MVKTPLAAAAVLGAALCLSGCTQDVENMNPLQATFSKNSVCGPARGRAVAALSEVLTNRLPTTLDIVEVRAVGVENLELRFARVGDRIDSLPIITGDPDLQKFESSTSGRFEVAPGEAFQLVAVGDVVDQSVDAVVHGFAIRYENDGTTVIARTPSTLVYAAKRCRGL